MRAATPHLGAQQTWITPFISLLPRPVTCWVKFFDIKMVLQILMGVLDLNHEGVKLLLSILAGYPLALIYDRWIRHLDPKVQHLYMMGGGLLLGFTNFGFDMCHSFVNILLLFTLVKTVGVTRFTLGFVFIFETIYLLVGCIYANENAQYVINWTTAQCVLCLRLIGLMWDLYDGTRPQEELSATQRESRIQTPPSLLEMFGFCYFYGTFLIGPHVTLRRYLDCIHGRLNPKDESGNEVIEGRQNSIARCMLRGFCCLAAYLVTSRYFYESAFNTKWFLEDITFCRRIFYMTMFGNFVLYRYLSAWLIAEAACILTGLGYNGKDANGKHKWNAVANIRVGLFIRARSCNDCVNSFNINTNKWMLEYIYKRLRFMNNRAISQLSTLSYLALWHGPYSGYFINFFIEFTVLTVEKELSAMIQRSWIKTYLDSPVGRPLTYVAGKLFILFIIGQALTAFCLLRFHLWFPVYKSVYFVAFILCAWPLLKLLVKMVLAPQRTRQE